MLVPFKWYDMREHQSVVLRRGLRLLVVAAAKLPAPVSAKDSLRAGLVVGSVKDLSVHISDARSDSFGVIRGSADIADDGWIVSFEAVTTLWRARLRHGVRPPRLEGGFGISAPVLVDGRMELDSLEVFDAILPSTKVRRNDDVGIYLETYGTEVSEALRFALSLRPTDASSSILGRIARALRLKSAPASVSIEWSEVANANAIGRPGRFVGVSFKDLQPGEYVMSVTLIRRNGELAVGNANVTILE
jgi:hypothetical protein